MDQNQIQKAYSPPANTPEFNEVARTVFQYNLLTAYPLADIQIEAYTKCIFELRPDIDVGILQSAINEMKLGKISFDPRLGIQNIFKACDTVIENRRKSKSYIPAEENTW